MQLNISGHHMSNGEALESYVSDKMDNNVKKYFKNAVKADVIFSRDKQGFKAQVVVNEGAGQHSIIAADAKSQDVYASFDLAMYRLVQQLRKLKAKIKDHHKKEAVRFKNKVA